MDLELQERKSTITESRSQFCGHHAVAGGLMDEHEFVNAESFSLDDGALIHGSKKSI